MLNRNQVESDIEFTELLNKVISWFKNIFKKNWKKFLSIFVLIAIFLIFIFLALPYMQSKNIISFKAIPKSSDAKHAYLSDEAFRKIIGLNYEDRVYISDTLRIKEALENDDRIFGGIKFNKKFFPQIVLEVVFDEAKPLFIRQNQFESSSVRYSDKGKVYENPNYEPLPIVNAGDSAEIFLSTKFLYAMRESDFSLYKSVSQIMPSKKVITVFFNDVPFRTEFSSESKSWKNAFRYYRQLSRKRDLKINSASLLNLRFSSDSLAYIE